MLLEDNKPRLQLRKALLAVKRWQDTPDHPQLREEHQEILEAHEAMCDELSELDLSWLPSPDNRFNQWLTKFHRTGNIAPVELGMGCSILVGLFGEPSDKSLEYVAIRHGKPFIWKYDDLEFHFDASGKLYLIHQDNEHGVLTTIGRRP